MESSAINAIYMCTYVYLHTYVNNIWQSKFSKTKGKTRTV